MTDPVFLVDAVPPPGPYLLDGDEGRHAAAARRMRPGEELVLSDGVGTWAPGTVEAVAARAVTVLVGAARIEPAPALTVTLVQALPKGERSDLAVELATEAGVDEIVPWQSMRCVARWDGSTDKAAKGRQRWQRTAREAAKQARRHRIPTIAPLATADEVRGLIEAADLALALHEDGSVPFAEVPLPVAGRIVLIVGPEGGLAPEELDELTGAGARPVRLGPHVLRTSTAAAVALGAIGVRTSRWS